MGLCDGNQCFPKFGAIIRAAFPVKKVSSSSVRGATVILLESGLDRQKLKWVIQGAGYLPLSIPEEPFKRSGSCEMWKDQNYSAFMFICREARFIQFHDQAA